MKIYDCFTFYNEFDLLELRLKELYNIVDHFVLVESDSTFTNIPKRFLFEENKDRYAQWMDKIIHIKVTDMPKSDNAWVNETYQRNAIMRGIVDADDDDIIIVSDVDEIIRPEAIELIRNSDEYLFALRMALFSFKLNYMRVNGDMYAIWAMAGRKHLLDDIAPDTFRNLRFQFMNSTGIVNGCQVIEHGGWHFGYMGDKEWLLDKAKSFAHTEVNTPEFLAQIDPQASIEKRTSWKQDSDDVYEIVNVDAYLPKTLQVDQSFSQYILDNPTVSAFDLLPTYTYN
jgi:Glycosyltransferase family 17